jgi:hypothetical protein
MPRSRRTFLALPCALRGWALPALAAAILAGGGALPARAGAALRSPSVGFDPGSPGAPVPADFLGLSFEVKSVPLMGSYAGQGNLVNYLRSLGSGVLRFGGVTADTQVAWAGGGPLPSWATLGLHAGDFGGIASLAQASGWRVLMTLNFAHYDPQATADEAAAAHQALGAGLSALSFGNEPDSYVPKTLRPDPWGFAPYEQQLSDLRAALRPAEAALPVAGPDVSSGRAHLAWVQAEALDVQPEMLTAHFYPLSWCAGFIPGISDLLSPGVKAAETRSLTQMGGLSAANGIPLRIDETNSISCGGEPGVSNTFASALWATDFIARAMAAGVAGINFHGNVANPSGYSPLAADTTDALHSGQLSAHPEWYALLLTRQLLAARPLPTTLLDGGADLSAQAFAAPDGTVRLVLVDERLPGGRSLPVTLHLPPSLAAATVLRLTGPSRSATSGVQLGGSGVAADGTWAPSAATPLIPSRHHGSLVVAMPPSSAALVTLYRRR